MRRIYAFIIMIITLTTLIVVRIPGLDQDKNLGMDYRGGFEVLYEIVPGKDSEMSARELASAAEAGISRRLEIANVVSYSVSKEGGKYIRVSVATPSVNDANEIKEVIEANSEITFRDQNNNLLATGAELLEEVAAEAGFSQNVNYVTLNIADTAKLQEITKDIAEAGENLVVWIGFEEGDSFENINTSAATARKVVFNGSVNEPLADEQITITQADRASAERTAAIINSSTYDFGMRYHYVNQVDAVDAASSFDFTVIALASALLVAIIALVVIYKNAGLVSAISLTFMGVFTLSFFNFTNGILTISSVAGLIVGLVLAIDAIVIVLERVKKEIYAGKDIYKAYNDGYKKALPSVMDALIATFIVSVVLFYLGNLMLQSFASMLLLAIVTTILSVLLINHFLLLVLTKTPLAKKISSFGAKEKHLEENNKEVKVNDRNILRSGKRYAFVFIGLIILSLGMAMVANFAMDKGYVNFQPEFKSGTTLVVETSENHFESKTDVEEFLTREDIDIVAKDITLTREEVEGVTTYVVTIKGGDELLTAQNAIDANLEKDLGVNTQVETYYTLRVNGSSSSATFVVLSNTLITTLIASLIIGFYLSIRYRYSYGIATLFTILHNVVALVAALVLFRIGVGMTLVPAVLAVVCYSVNAVVVIFARVKEFLISKRRVYISNEERVTAINSALSASLSRLVNSAIIIALALVALIVIAPTSATLFNIVLIIGIALAITASLLVAPLVLLILEYRIDKKERTFKPKKEHKYFKEKEERVFIGLND